MKTLRIIASLLLTFSVILPSEASEIVNFNQQWKFRLCETSVVNDWSAPSLDDSCWRILDVPHDWSIEGRALVYLKCYTKQPRLIVSNK